MKSKGKTLLVITAHVPAVTATAGKLYQLVCEFRERCGKSYINKTINNI